MRWKNYVLRRRVRDRICDRSPAVGKVTISTDQTQKFKRTKVNIDESQGKSDSMVSTGIY